MFDPASVLAVLVPVGALVLLVLKFGGLSRQYERQARDAQAYREGIDKSMRANTAKIAKLETDFRDAQISTVASFSGLKDWALGQFTPMDEVRQRFKALSADTQEIKDMITQMRSDRINSLSQENAKLLDEVRELRKP